MVDETSKVVVENEVSDRVKVLPVKVIVPGGGPIHIFPNGQQPPSSQNSLQINYLVTKQLLEKRILSKTTGPIH